MASISATGRDPFAPQAHNYIKFRPGYPNELVNWLVDSCKGRDVAVDVGCGSGQMTRALAQHFTHVIGIDRSVAQISQAPSGSSTSTVSPPTSATLNPTSSASKVEYRVGDATNLTAEAVGIADGTVDCITAAQMVHWLTKREGQMDAFTTQIKRMLKPETGRFLIAGYGLGEPGPEALKVEFKKLYSALDEADRWAYECDRHQLDKGMVDYQFPHMKIISHRWFPTVQRMKLLSFYQYVDTWSAFSDQRSSSSSTKQGAGGDDDAAAAAGGGGGGDVVSNFVDEVKELRAKVLQRDPTLHDDADIEFHLPFFAIQLEVGDN